MQMVVAITRTRIAYAADATVRLCATTSLLQVATNIMTCTSRFDGEFWRNVFCCPDGIYSAAPDV